VKKSLEIGKKKRFYKSHKEKQIVGTGVQEGRIQERLLDSRRIAYQSLAARATNVYFLACKSAKEKKISKFSLTTSKI
jgi:hypothetical protein